MVCPRCGGPTLDNLPFCPNCDRVVDPRAFVDRAPATGVHGWLGVYVFILKYLNPFLMLLGVLWWLRRGFTASAPILPNMPVLDVVNVLASVFITCFGLYAGHRLEKICPGAVHTVKQYLLLCFLYSVAILLTIGGATLLHFVGTKEFRIGLENFISGSVWLEIWYLYFTRSRRVANTYTLATAHS